MTAPLLPQHHAPSERLPPPLSLEVWSEVAAQLRTPDLRSLMRSQPGYFCSDAMRGLLEQRQRRDMERTTPARWLLALARGEQTTTAEEFAAKSFYSLGLSCISCCLIGVLLLSGALRNPLWLLPAVPMAVGFGSVAATSLRSKLTLVTGANILFGLEFVALFLMIAKAEQEAKERRSEGEAPPPRDSSPWTVPVTIAMFAAGYVLCRYSARRIRYYDVGASDLMPLPTRERFVALGEAVEPAGNESWDSTSWGNKRLRQLDEFSSTGWQCSLALLQKENSPASIAKLNTFLKKRMLNVDPFFTVAAFSFGKAPDTFSRQAYRDATQCEELWARTIRPDSVAQRLVSDLKKDGTAFPRAHALFRGTRLGSEYAAGKAVLPDLLEEHDDIGRYNKLLAANGSALSNDEND